MLEAWDNRYQRSLTVGDYVAAYGPRSDVRYRPAFRPKLRCLVCSGTLHTVHEGSPSAQWVHDPNPARKCSARHPIPILQRLPDSRGAYSEAAVSLRAAFFRNWGRHWSRARKLCRNATIESFVAFVTEADRVGLWEQVGVREGFVPYIFLAEGDFPGRGCRVMACAQHWLRFAFDWRIESLSDLELCADGSPRFIRMEFKAPPRGELRFDSLIRQEPIAMNTTYVYLPVDDLAESDIITMEEAFPRELGSCVAA